MFLKEGVSLQCNHSLEILVHTTYKSGCCYCEKLRKSKQRRNGSSSIYASDGEENSRCLVKLLCVVHYTWSHIYKFVAPWARSSVTYVCRYFCHNISIILLFVNDISNYLGMLLGIFKVLFLKNLDNASHLIRSLVAD